MTILTHHPEEMKTDSGTCKTAENQREPAPQNAEELLGMFGGTVFSAAYAMVKNRQDAEDIAQDVFVSYIRTKPEFESREHAKAWLLRVAANRCKSFFRSAWQRKTQGLEEDFPEEAFTPQETGVMQAVEALPAKYRQVIYLYYIEGYAAKEIAQILGVPQNTVLSRMARARKMLEKELKGEFDDVQ